MPLCDSVDRDFHARLAMAFLLGLLFVSARPACAQEALETEISTESLWSPEFPKVETRIVWNWPQLAWREGWWTIPREEFSPGDSIPRPSFGKLFGRIDWLSPRQEPAEVELTDANLIVRADDGRLFSAWGTGADPQITLVRGGVPQLFGARGRLRGEYGDEFDDVKRIRGQMLLNLIGNHIGIDTSVNSWEDHRPRPEALGDFWTGDANLVYSLGAQRVAMRGGLGAAWVYDNDLDVGYNFTYGADLYLTRPWLLSGEVDYGQINSEKFFHWRATAGVQLMMFEVYLGYDSYKWDRIRFDGPVAGAGIWF